MNYDTDCKIQDWGRFRTYYGGDRFGSPEDYVCIGVAPCGPSPIFAVVCEYLTTYHEGGRVYVQYTDIPAIVDRARDIIERYSFNPSLQRCAREVLGYISAWGRWVSGRVDLSLQKPVDSSVEAAHQFLLVRGARSVSQVIVGGV